MEQGFDRLCAQCFPNCTEKMFLLPKKDRMLFLPLFSVDLLGLFPLRAAQPLEDLEGGKEDPKILAKEEEEEEVSELK